MALSSNLRNGLRAVLNGEISFSAVGRCLSDIAKTSSEMPTITRQGAAFEGDLRSTSALGVGDGVTSHTDKWLSPGHKSPLEYAAEIEPIKVKGLVVASTGSDDIPSLGCPVEYIDLKGTSYENPAVCKYTGNKYYSDDWKNGGAAH